MLGFKFVESLLFFVALALVFSLTGRGQPGEDLPKEESEVLTGQRDPFDIIKIYRTKDGRERVEINIPKFLSRVNAANRFAQRMTVLAAEKSSSERVKSYADRVSRDYLLIQKQLDKLARKKGIPIDKVHLYSDQDRRSDLIREWWEDLLEVRQGRELEEPYLRWAIRWNRRALRSYQGMAGLLADAETREFVSDVVPIIKQHLALAKALRRGEHYAR